MRRIVLFACMIMLLSILCSTNAATKISGYSLKQQGSSLKNFNYEIDGDKIKLTLYIGEEESTVVPSVFTIDGKTYKTDLSNFMVGITNEYPKEILFSEGIEELPLYVFNSCRVIKFYLPKSLKKWSPSGLSYFGSRKDKPIKVYYAGSIEEFEELLKNNVSWYSEEDKQNLNVFLDLDFDASDFDFIFEATEEDYFSGEYD
ncbi:hypothetical protein JS518_14040 [Clostridiales bacterium FE2010]|nr:hypothetical protein JS518_14040 [Clostridiales bacterium FE2010]